ncbi:MAG TPA: hypothetical protein PLJ60_11915 [Chryseolinea sp.]|nr:hypothetical protein [Chryseolinea sp.]HPH46388.1 hypothetical protein [Chryseolinea sp.]HPM31030.1 hypothetical protein [Chryseolinea sp.]
MKNNSKYRVFKTSINVLIFHHYGNSKVYQINKRSDLFWPVFCYSSLTFLFGFFGRRIDKSMEALEINFSGGEDHSKLIVENQYDETTNLVWSNLKRITSERIDRQAVKLLLDQQEHYMETKSDAFSVYNVFYLKNELSRNRYVDIQDDDILDFFDSLQILGKTK